MDLHVGCAMWTLGSWQGRQLPKVLATREKLRAYSTWCTAVEGNTTFYATPSVETARMWAEQVDPGFRFVLKLPKPVTHERRLAGVEEIVRHFLTAIEPLGARTHALWVQLPPGFSPGDVGVLAAFLRRMPRDYRYVVEVRHRAFFEDERAASCWSGCSARSAPNGPSSTRPSCTPNPRPPTPSARPGQEAAPAPADAGPDAVPRRALHRPRRSRRPPPRAGSPGSRRSPTGCARGARRRSSSTRPTTPTRWISRGGSMTEVREQVPELAALPAPMPAEPPTLF